MNLYVLDMRTLAAYAICALAVWGGLRVAADGRPAWRRAFMATNALLATVTLYGILSHTVLGRASGGEHRFVWFNYFPGETVREMFMNALLYAPLGATLGCVMGPWSVLASLLLSVGVEAWQYVAGTGLAQGTDVLFNTVGCAVGVVPHLVAGRMRKALGREAARDPEG